MRAKCAARHEDASALIELKIRSEKQNSFTNICHGSARDSESGTTLILSWHCYGAELNPMMRHHASASDIGSLELTAV
jgi:hypothetical protein